MKIYKVRGLLSGIHWDNLCEFEVHASSEEQAILEIMAVSLVKDINGNFINTKYIVKAEAEVL